MAIKKSTTAENATENAEVKEIANEAEKGQEMANTEAKEGRFIYIGPSLNTGIKENAVFCGTRESVEQYIKPTIDKYPQVRALLVTTESLTAAKNKVRSTGTLLNKYYNDILSLSHKNREG